MLWHRLPRRLLQVSVAPAAAERSTALSGGQNVLSTAEQARVTGAHQPTTGQWDALPVSRSQPQQTVPKPKGTGTVSTVINSKLCSSFLYPNSGLQKNTWVVYSLGKHCFCGARLRSGCPFGTNFDALNPNFLIKILFLSQLVGIIISICFCRSVRSSANDSQRKGAAAGVGAGSEKRHLKMWALFHSPTNRHIRHFVIM